jgi:tRNA modification GTPase
MRRLLAPAEVVLAGPPNAGKSTLGNALVGRPVSLVHETPGTTRDWVRELAILNGLPVWVTDTAGLWSSTGILPVGIAGVPPADGNGELPQDAPLRADVESQSARRALERIGRADVVLLLGQPPADLGGLDGPGIRRKIIPVWTKSDLRPRDAPPVSGGTVAVSAHTGEGMDRLRQAILHALGLDGFDPALPRAFTERQASLLASAAEAMERDETPATRACLLRILEG